MAFPEDVLGTHVQMYIDNAWTDVMRYDDDTKILESEGVSITRGSGGLENRPKTGVCSWKWTDPNGVFNNENPRSPYFGLLPRNTPVRVYVPRETTSMLIVDQNDGARAWTADKAALDITGDIEIRMDFEPRRWTRWASGTNKVMLLCAKYVTTGSQRSWYVRFGEPLTANSLGSLVVVWSTDGTSANSRTVGATEDIPIPESGRLSIKITIDVNNGAGQHEVKFYTADTIDGTYTQLGSTVVGSGTTSIFNSTSPVEVGTFQNGGLDYVVSSQIINYVGRVYGFRLYNGIGGSLVAEADFTGETTGTTSWSDGLGNTWAVTGVAEITDADYRFHGEYSAPKLEPRRTADGVGIDVKIAAEAGGLIRRIAANQVPVTAPITLAFQAKLPTGYWPGDDQSTGQLFASAGAEGIKPATVSGITFEGFDPLIAGAAGVMECGTDPSFMATCRTTAATTESHFYAFFKFPAVPGADRILFTWYSTGTIKQYRLTVTAGTYRLAGFNAIGGSLFSANVLFGTGGEPDQWIAYHSRQIQNGGNIDVSHEWVPVGTDLYFSGGVSSVAGTVGRIASVRLQAFSTDLDGVQFCQVMTTSTVGSAFHSSDEATNVMNYSRGFAGELADARFRRICDLLGISWVVVGNRDDSEEMGAQPIAAGMDILYEIPEVDGGMLVEAVDQLALEYHTRKSLYNKNVNSLTWAHLPQGIEGTSDDTDVANDVTLKRDGGGSARATLEYGPMSIQAPPNGINAVPGGDDINAYDLEQLTYLTQFYLHTHTWPTSRYPSLNIDMHRRDFAGDADLFAMARNLDIGEVLELSALPNFMAPEPLQLLIKGQTETLYGRLWEISYSTIPYGPYITSETQTRGDYSNFRASQHTIDGVVQTQLNADIDDNDTSISIKTLTGPLLLEGVISPSFRIKIDGEFMDVTNVSGSSSPQTVTVTRGVVDGYAASHSANTYVYLYPTLKARL